MAINLEARLVFRGDSAIRAIDRLESRMRKLDRTIDSIDRSTNALDRGMDGAAGATRKVSRALDAVAPAARKADRQVERLNRSLRQTERRGNSIGNLLGGKLRGIGGAVVRGGFNMLGNIAHTAMITGTAALGGAAYLSGRGLGLAAEQEQAHIAFSTMLGSGAAADAFLDDLKEFAKVTPFDVGGLRDSSRQLLAYGFAAEEVLPMMTAIGNATAGLGLGQEGIDRVSRALGQMRAKGKVSSEEMLQLTEAGISAWEFLAEDIGVTTGEIMNLTQRGLIPADRAIKSIIDGMNRKFPNMMERQSRSLSGLWAKMKETFDYDILLRWGQGIANAIKPRLESLSRWLDANEETLQRWGDVLQQTATQATEWLVSKAEDAFNYINDRYINNPEFLELDFVGKVKFIFDDITNAVDEWLNSGGRDSLQKAADGFGEILGAGLAEIAEPLSDVALSMGSSFAKGFLGGLGEGISESIRGSALFSWSPGNQAEKTLEGLQSFDEKYGIRSDEFDINNPDYDRLFGGAEASWGEVQSKGWFRDTWDGLRHRVNQHIRGFSGGLSNVPYNGFVARLHKGERVLTAEENKAYTKGGTGGVNITIQHMEVREEADVKKFAVELAREIRQARAIGA